MAASKLKEPTWLDAPEEHDYPAAASYLALTMAPKKVSKIVSSLKKAKISHFKAKDMFRASVMNAAAWASLDRSSAFETGCSMAENIITRVLHF